MKSSNLRRALSLNGAWASIAAALSIAALAALVAAAPATATEPPCSTGLSRTFGSTGEQQCYVVPAGTHQLHVTAIGAAGGPGINGEAPGRGAVVGGYLQVTPGETLYVEVGSNGAVNGPAPFGGGGAAGDDTGSGGGASDIRTCSIATCALTAQDTRLLVAGGGGGGAYAGSSSEGAPGGAGGSAGVAGQKEGAPGGNGTLGGPNSAPGEGGKGGTLTAGGAGGEGGAGTDIPGSNGNPGSLGQGGGGGNPGGAGGGGYYGGGQGGESGFSLEGGQESGEGGGGAGSSYTALVITGVTIATAAPGVQPSVTLESTAPTAAITAPTSGATFKAGEGVTLEFECAAGAGGSQLESCEDSNGVSAGPGGTGTDTFTAGSPGQHSVAVTAIAEDGGEGKAEIDYTVVKAQPTLGVGPSGTFVVGEAIKPEATLGGGDSPSGNLSVSVWAPGHPNCTGSPAAIAGFTAGGDGNYQDPSGFIPSEAGTYLIEAEYQGDGNNEGATVSCASAPFTVDKATPTLTSEASAPVALGGSVFDTATLAGGYAPSGTIGFSAFGPGDPTCAGPAVWSSSPSTVVGDDEYESEAFVPSAPGTYTLVAAYSGDPGNEGAESGCGEAAASVVIGRASATIALAVGPDPATAGSPVTLTAKVTGAAPGGIVTFFDGTTAIGHVALGADGSASLTTSSLAVGSHSLKAEYEGDAKNLPAASPSVAETVVEAASVVKPAPASNPPAPPAPPAAPAPSAPSKVSIGYSPNSAHSPDPKGGARWTFRFGGAESGTRFVCRMDHGKWGSCGSPKVYRGLKPGRHVFEVKKIAADGLESPVQKVTFAAHRRRAHP